MSEFQRTPESMKAELVEIKEELVELNQQLAGLPEGDYEVTDSDEARETIMEKATTLKRLELDLLLALNDIEGIEIKLTNITQEAVELYGEEGMPVYIETIMEDAFAVELDDNIDARIKTILDKLTEQFDLQSFEIEDDDTE